MIRLVIYEDNDKLRASLSLLFSSVKDVDLVAAYSHCLDAAAQIAEHLPDVVLMDIDMPGADGISGVRAIREVSPHTNVLMYTVFDDDQKIFDSLAAGANGYMLKNASPIALHEAIRDVSAGGSPMSPGVARKVLESFRNKPAATREEHVQLSDREQEVLVMLTRGYTYKRIASECGTSIDTTRTHIKNIYAKLHVNCGTEAVAKAVRLRLVDAPM